MRISFVPQKLKQLLEFKLKTYCGTSVFRKVSAALQLSVQLSLGCKLKDEVYASWVMEVTIKTEDVGVPGRKHCSCVGHSSKLSDLKVSDLKWVILGPGFATVPAVLKLTWQQDSISTMRTKHTAHNV